MGDQPCLKAAACTGQNKRSRNADIHASSRIRTHNPSASAGEDTSCPTTSGHSDLLPSFQIPNEQNSIINPILSQLGPLNIYTLHFTKINFNIVSIRLKVHQAISLLQVLRFKFK
jgi:hypothetical protein